MGKKITDTSGDEKLVTPEPPQVMDPSKPPKKKSKALKKKAIRRSPALTRK